MKEAGRGAGLEAALMQGLGAEAFRKPGVSRAHAGSGRGGAGLGMLLEDGRPEVLSWETGAEAE